MFRRAFTFASRFAFVGAAGIGGATAGAGLLSAAALAIDQGKASAKTSWTDAQEAQLKERPGWYRESLERLEYVLKKLSLCSYIEDPEFLDDAIDILQRVENVNNCEISWRLGRAYVEKSMMYPKRAAEKRIHLLETGLKHLQKAIQLEPSEGSAGAHKWYALALIRIKELDSSNAHVKKSGDNKYLIEHLEKAVKVDSNDAIAYHLLGFCHFYAGNIDDAVKNFRAAEKLKSGYFSANLAYLGMALARNKQKEEAVAVMKQALTTPAKNRVDRKTKVIARAFLINQLGQSQQDLAYVEEY